jgi:hypothetical protein
LKQAKEEHLDKIWVAQQEKEDMKVNFGEDREPIQREKYQLLTEHTVVKEAVARELRSVSGLA